MTTINIDIQHACEYPNVPDDATLNTWAITTLEQEHQTGQVCIRLVDVAESAELNHAYRQKQGPTNVLSFPQDSPEHLTPPLLGDIVICLPLVAEQAIAQAKPFDAHLAHLIVHGTLHLLGYKHQHDDDAHNMMAREINTLKQLGFANPYEAVTYE